VKQLEYKKMSFFLPMKFWPRHTSTTVQAEIASLHKVLGLLRALDGHSEENCAGISTQIEVLTEDMLRDDVLANYEDEHIPAYVLKAALSAVDWLRGDGTAPSNVWAGLLDLPDTGSVVN
jgi:hypothetical protein